MAIPVSWLDTVDTFFARVEALDGLLSGTMVAFVAVRTSSGFVVVNGMVRLVQGQSDFPPLHFESPSVIAGNFNLADTGRTAREFFELLATGKVLTPFGELLFPDNDGNGHAYYREDLHPHGLLLNERTESLRLAGPDFRRFARLPAVDWELKAADEPYDSLEELMLSCGLGPIPDQVQFEFAVFGFALLDDTAEFYDGLVAPRLIVIHGVDQEKIKVGYRVVSSGQIVSRGSIKGRELNWTVTASETTATFELPVPDGASIQCIVSYENIAQHFVWLSDPTKAANEKRAVYEAFDPGLGSLRELIGDYERKGNGAHDFEAAISWLLWMLGFNTCFLGEVSRLKQGPDTMAMTPQGQIIVVECTTGRLNDKDKLSKLSNRTMAVRKSLLKSNAPERRVVPLIVTTKPRDEIVADLNRAVEIGALVICQDEIYQWLKDTLKIPTADVRFIEWERQIEIEQVAARTIDGGQW
jgi:hypothetical protein